MSDSTSSQEADKTRSRLTGVAGIERPRREGVGEPQAVDANNPVFQAALEVMRKEFPPPDASTVEVEKSLDPVIPSSEATRRSDAKPEPQLIPARMLNEFVYCQRLFYYEFVESVFVENTDTLRGDVIHKRVDSGDGAMPASKTKNTAKQKPGGESEKGNPDADHSPAASDAQAAASASSAEPEIIHSRSVQMGSKRLGVVAKMDLVESKASDDLFSALVVCPVDYKAGAPKEGEDANELWDTDKIQLGLQALVLRDNGYTCNEGVIYYRATKQRVRLSITAELESWILKNIADAQQIIAGPIPAPLAHSPKCVRCSLAPVCLPDETRMLAPAEAKADVSAEQSASQSLQSESQSPRRLIAARGDTRTLYLNTPGYRVGCKDEVLTVKDKDKLVDEVRMRDVSHVALFGNIQISTQAIQSLCEMEIPVTYFSMGGWFYGITRGHGLKNVFQRIEQFRLARDEKFCLSLARQFVHGKIRNHRTLLMRNHLEPPEAAIAKLKRASEDALAASAIDELLGIEGAAASQYFQQFGRDDQSRRRFARTRPGRRKHPAAAIQFQLQQPQPSSSHRSCQRHAFAGLQHAGQRLHPGGACCWFRSLPRILPPTPVRTTRVGTRLDGRIQADNRGVHRIELHQQPRRHRQRLCEGRRSGQPYCPGKETIFPNLRTADELAHYSPALRLQSQLSTGIGIASAPAGQNTDGRNCRIHSINDEVNHENDLLGLLRRGQRQTVAKSIQDMWQFWQPPPIFSIRVRFEPIGKN